MASFGNETELIGSSKSTEAFLSYFQQAITGLAPLDSLQDDAQMLGNAGVSVFSRVLSAGMQTLMKEIVQDIRWFQEKGRSSALRVGKLRADAEKLEAGTDETDVWHQNLTIQDIQRNISEISQVYGKEGTERLSQLQEKIVKFHQEVIAPAKRDITTKLIEQDRRTRREEARQIGYRNAEVPIGRPADLVTYSVTIGLAVLRPFVKVFFHKRAQASKDRVKAMQIEARADRAKLCVAEAYEEKLRVSREALKQCSEALITLNDVLYGEMTEHMTRMVNAQRREETDEFPDDLEFMCLELKSLLSSHRSFDIQVDELLDQLESLEHSPIKNHATIQVEEFYHVTKNISSDIESLLSIEELIHEDRRHDFKTNTCKIAQGMVDMLSKVQHVFDLWGRHTRLGTGKPVSYSLRKEAAGVVQGLLPFDREIRECTDNIKKLLHKKHSKSSSKSLQELQRDGDRLHKGSTSWDGRSLATTSEAGEIVQKLNYMADAVSTLSNEIMLPLTLTSSDEADGSNLERCGEEVFAVPESTLTMITTALSLESSILKNLASKGMVLTSRNTK